METAPLEILIEAALFFRGGAVSVAELAKSLDAAPEEVEKALDALKTSLERRGLRLVREGKTAALATAPEANELIEKMRKDELEGPLGKAGLETLAVIIFRGPVSKSDIDYIRGVNCGYILRSLMIRGLIERVENPEDKRSFIYRATPELPAYLGVSSLEEIPGYGEVREKIETAFAARMDEEGKGETSAA
jgi:segregation and condensation protein B